VRRDGQTPPPLPVDVVLKLVVDRIKSEQFVQRCRKMALEGHSDIERKERDNLSGWSHIKRFFSFQKLSDSELDSEVYYTIFLILLAKIMMCSQFRRQKV
jgi:hypothetical protein